MEKIALIPQTLILPGEKQIVDPLGGRFNSIGGLISGLLPFIMVIAGLILFVLLIIGGFGLLTSGGNPEKMKVAQGKITSAVIGFVIIFISYWLMRILEMILGIDILGII